MKLLRIGSRGSALALWQAEHIRKLLAEAHGLDCEVIRIQTCGDRLPGASFGGMGLKGVFIKEIEDALLDGRVDLAVHSLKDVPTEIPAGLAFPAFTRRDDVRDCLVSRSGQRFQALPPGTRIATSSLRRQAQLRYVRKDIFVTDLRGNVDTRLRKLEAGEFDAAVLAKAGLERLGFAHKIAEILSPEVMLPAAGQGALGVECRADDAALMEEIARLDDADTRSSVTAERALLAELQGGCQVPLGAWGRIVDGELVLDACVLAADGSERVALSREGSPQEAEKIGRELGRALLGAGADRLLRLAGRSVGGH